MTTRNSAPPTKRGAAHDSDPWWGLGGELDAIAGATTTMPGVAEGRARPRTPRMSERRPRRRRSLLRTLLALPVLLIATLLARSPRLRRMAIRLVVLLVIATVVAGAVGVILLNNEVIGRTAELGRLDTKRRELRRDNAVLSAEAARQSAPPRVVRDAERRLGMVRSTDMPVYTYLDPASHQITALERRRIAARRAAAAAAAEEAQ